LSDERRCFVGLARFSSNGGEFCDRQLIEVLFSNPDIKWIALLPPDALANENVRKLVVDYFYDFHKLPIDAERLQTVLGHARGNAELHNDVRQQQQEDQTDTDQGLVGDSAVIKVLRQQIRKIARVDTPVLITGESGTGKELAANLIHRNSSRATGPFVAVNCAALPANLIQAELFGYEKGAFTGAYQRKIGRIESANTGTIFLDEIGDLPPDMQITLLRFLEEHTIDRVGGIEPISVNVRVIAATNVNLQDMVKRGSFREDLYFRLKVLLLRMPTLAERGQDLALLACYFFKKFEHEKRPAVKDFSQSAMQAMYSYSWPGNIRELMNAVRRAMVMSDGPLIMPADLGLERRTLRRQAKTLDETRIAAEKAAILYAFDNTGNNMTRTAEFLDISRGTLYRLMEKHGIGWQKDSQRQMQDSPDMAQDGDQSRLH
jgi:DNA-binding NtrC family response regulator